MELNWKKYSDHLVKKIEFNSQEDLVNYILAIAKHSDKQKHHCDMEIYKASKLKLTLTTHDAGATLTNKDYELAKWIDQLEETIG